MPPFEVEQITSLETEGLSPYLTLRRYEAHKEEGIVVAEGGKVVERLLASQLRIRSLLLTREWFERLASVLLEKEGPACRVFLGELSLLREIVGFRLHQGVLAVAEIPEEPSVELLPRPHLLVACDGLTQSENVGVIVRSAAALGANGVISGEGSSSPYLRRAVRNSMGAVFSLPVFHPSSLARMLADLRSGWGTVIIGADASEGKSLHEVDLRGNICCVAGNEEAGLSAEVRALCAERVRIPMANGIDSLNVASAVSVLLYAASRQRAGN
jgi:tRNA G18 (ribose-2'-O)-methylase SpoU